MEAVFLLPLILGLAMEVVASCWHGGSVPVALNLGSGHGGCCQLLLACRQCPVALNLGSGHGGCC